MSPSDSKSMFDIAQGNIHLKNKLTQPYIYITKSSARLMFILVLKKYCWMLPQEIHIHSIYTNYNANTFPNSSVNRNEFSSLQVCPGCE